MQNQFERYKLMQYDDKRQLLREQQNLVQAMQRQFDEYRETSEVGWRRLAVVSTASSPLLRSRV